MAALYGQNLKQRIVVFDEEIQRVMIDAGADACAALECRCHFISTDATHMHVLASWSSDRGWDIVRKQIRYNVTLSLNRDLKRQQWFSKSPRRKQIKDLQHFNYLTTTYLPRHSGLKWSEAHGVHV